MRLVPVAQTDMERLTALESACCTAYVTWTRYQWQEFFDNPGEVLVARVADTEDAADIDIGLVCYTPPKPYENRSDEIGVHLIKFGIHQDYRECGLGTDFYYALARRWFLEGATYFWTKVHEAHDAELAFWETLGFTREMTEDFNGHTFWNLSQSLCRS